jgi:uncharacterized protein YjaZ
MMMKNLFRLLPPELKSEIIQYDNTYRSVFKQPDFKHELFFKQFFIANQHAFIQQFDEQLNSILDIIFYDFDSGQWKNEYGVLSSNFYEEVDDYDFLKNGYKFKFFPENNDIIKFKILPINQKIEEDFLNSTEKTYDGFICSYRKHQFYKHKLLSKPISNTFCHYENILTIFDFVIYLSYPN